MEGELDVDSDLDPEALRCFLSSLDSDSYRAVSEGDCLWECSLRNDTGELCIIEVMADEYSGQPVLNYIGGSVFVYACIIREASQRFGGFTLYNLSNDVCLFIDQYTSDAVIKRFCEQ